MLIFIKFRQNNQFISKQAFAMRLKIFCLALRGKFILSRASYFILFGKSFRALSHGCMRVQDPTKFGEIMLGLTMNGATPR